MSQAGQPITITMPKPSGQKVVTVVQGQPQVQLQPGQQVITTHHQPQTTVQVQAGQLIQQQQHADTEQARACNDEGVLTDDEAGMSRWGSSSSLSSLPESEPEIPLPGGDDMAVLTEDEQGPAVDGVEQAAGGDIVPPEAIPEDGVPQGSTDAEGIEPVEPMVAEGADEAGGDAVAAADAVLAGEDGQHEAQQQDQETAQQLGEAGDAAASGELGATPVAGGGDEEANELATAGGNIPEGAVSAELDGADLTEAGVAVGDAETAEAEAAVAAASHVEGVMAEEADALGQAIVDAAVALGEGHQPEDPAALAAVVAQAQMQSADAGDAAVEGGTSEPPQVEMTPEEAQMLAMENPGALPPEQMCADDPPMETDGE